MLRVALIHPRIAYTESTVGSWLGQCYTSSELTTEIFQIKLADSWVLGWLVLAG